ncbi:MAG TPA: TolC family protein [Kofleriaceae bacterium]|jgi:outer membrane protein TolC|nr:TolC family protein [Kofleriaceae bacterium]
MVRLLIVACVAAIAFGYARADDTPPDAGQPLSLDDAMQAAERASETLQIAQADLDRARSQVINARSGYLPTVNGTAAYQRTLASEFDSINFGAFGMGSGSGSGSAPDVELPFGQRNNWRLGVQAQQPLFDGFRTAAALEQAKSGVRFSELGVQSTRAQVVLQVALAYYDAALANRQVEIGEVTLQQADATLAETNLKFKQGTAPEFDLVRAQVARDNQSNAVVEFRVQRDSAFVQLRRLVGIPLDRPLTLSTKLEADDVDAMVEQARRAAGMPPSPTRLVVAQAKEGVAVREAGVKLAKSAWYPSVAAGTDFGLVNYHDHPFNSDWRTNWTLGLTLSLPIFDGFRRLANQRASEADLKQAKAVAQNAIEVSEVDAEQAAAAVAAAAQTLETSTRTVGQAERAYQIAELRFQQGASTHLELVDARVQLEQALLIKARSSRQLRAARLREALLPGLPLGGAVAPF